MQVEMPKELKRDHKCQHKCLLLSLTLEYSSHSGSILRVNIGVNTTMLVSTAGKEEIIQHCSKK